MKMVNGEPIIRDRRWLKSMPFDFSRRTEVSRSIRVLAALTLSIGLIPLCFDIPLGWAFALRVLFIAGIGVAQNTGLWGRLSLLAIDFSTMLIWMFSGFPTEASHVAVAVFVLGVSFKSLELRTVGDCYMVSAMSFLGPFLAFTQESPPFVWGVSVLCIPLALLLRSVLSAVEAGNPVKNPWSWKYWRPLIWLSLMAVPVAMLVFFLFPRLPTSFFSFQQKNASQGISNSMEPGSFIQNFKDESPALMASFSGELPNKNDLYWRAIVMTQFDGRVWRPQALPRHEEKEALVPDHQTTYKYAINLMPQKTPYLALLDRPLNVSSGRVFWSSSQTIIASSPRNAMSDFFVQSAPSALLDAGQDQLPEALLKPNLALPEGFNPKTKKLVQQWKAQGFTEQKLVDRTLAYFRETMTYTYTPPLLGRDTVDELLFETHQGYCEHFSSAFAFMMRSGGLPARIITGYAGGEVIGNGKTLVVKQMDAHAWVEVWLKNKGWVRVDPTFTITGGRPPPMDNRQSLSESSSSSWFKWVQEGARKWVGDFDIQKQRALLRQWQFDSFKSWLITGAVALVLGFCVFTAFWVRPKGNRLADNNRKHWEALRIRLEKRSQADFSTTPRQLLARLKFITPQDHWEILKDLFDRVEKWDYANHSDPELAKELKKMINVERRLHWEQFTERFLQKIGVKS